MRVTRRGYLFETPVHRMILIPQQTGAPLPDPLYNLLPPSSLPSQTETPTHPFHSPLAPSISPTPPLPFLLLHLPPRIQHHLLPPPLQKRLPLILITTPQWRRRCLPIPARRRLSYPRRKVVSRYQIRVRRFVFWRRRTRRRRQGR